MKMTIADDLPDIDNKLIKVELIEEWVEFQSCKIIYNFYLENEDAVEKATKRSLQSINASGPFDLSGRNLLRVAADLKKADRSSRLTQTESSGNLRTRIFENHHKEHLGKESASEIDDQKWEYYFLYLGLISLHYIARPDETVD